VITSIIILLSTTPLLIKFKIILYFTVKFSHYNIRYTADIGMSQMSSALRSTLMHFAEFVFDTANLFAGDETASISIKR